MRVWTGKRFSVFVEDGYEIADTPDAVAILAVDAEDRVVLVRQQRLATGGSCSSFRRGSSTRARSRWTARSASCARKPACAAAGWRELTSFWSSPGFVNERVWVFVATDLDEGETEPDEGEELEIVRWPLSEVEARLAELEDATTLIGLLIYLRESS